MKSYSTLLDDEDVVDLYIEIVKLCHHISDDIASHLPMYATGAHRRDGCLFAKQIW